MDIALTAESRQKVQTLSAPAGNFPSAATTGVRAAQSEASEPAFVYAQSLLHLGRAIHFISHMCRSPNTVLKLGLHFFAAAAEAVNCIQFLSGSSVCL